MSELDTRAPVSDGAERVYNRPADPLGADPLADNLSADVGSAPILRKESGLPAFAGQSMFDSATSGGGGEMPHRGAMETAFQSDFSGVTAFTGKSDESAAMGAEAATQGDKMVFADSSPSVETVAHEAAHVMQGRNGQSFSSDGAFGSAGSPAESEADSAASAVASGGTVNITGTVDAPIHRRKKIPGSDPQEDYSDLISADDFKGKISGWTKGDNLTAIINWLKAIDSAEAAKDGPRFRKAISECKAAAGHWQVQHPDPDKEGGSVKKNAPVVRALFGALGLVDPSIVSVTSLGSGSRVVGTQVEDEVEAPTGYDVAESVSGVGPSSIEKIGQGVDIHGDDSHYGEVIGPKVDMVEGSFAIGSSISELVLGGHKMKSGYKTLKDQTSSEEEKKKAKKELGTGVIDVTSGVMLGGQGIGKMISSGKQMVTGDTTKGVTSGKISEGFGGGGSVLGVISEGIDLVDNLTKEKEVGETEDEKLHRYTNITQNVIGMARSSADAVNSFTKAATGAASVGASTTSGVLGVVTGTIDLVESSYEAYTAIASKKNLEKVRETLKATYKRLDNQTYHLGVMKAMSRTQTYKDHYQALCDKVVEELNGLQELEKEMEVAFQAMEQVQNRRLKKAVFKGVTGTMDVVGGLLVVTGVGAPVAITLAAFSALLKLGNVGLQWGRASKASKLTEIALRLNDDGTAKGKPDDAKDVGYRKMEQRVYAAYYKNFDKTDDDKPYPDGLNSTSWGHIRDFVHEEKLSSVAPEKKEKIKRSAAAGQSHSGWGKKWADFTKDDGTTDDGTEYPGRLRRAGLTFTFSAHESAQAIDASNSELADAVYSIAVGAFDPSKKAFVSTEVTASGGTEETSKGAIKKAMATTLLASVGIKDSQWQEIWRASGGHFKGEMDKTQSPPTAYPGDQAPDPDKVKGFIKKKIDST